MLISHKYKFIFIRPKKVGGTSVIANLARQCGEEDIRSTYRAITTSEDDHIQRVKLGTHPCPKRIRKYVGDDIWKNYFKFTIVRNPWDYMISRYFWELQNSSTGHVKKNSEQNTFKFIKIFNKGDIRKILGYLISIFKSCRANKSFPDFVKSIPPRFIYPGMYNTHFYFDLYVKPVADFYIRFEQIEKDYKKLCERLGIPYKPLPKKKTHTRESQHHYSEYYTPELRDIVYKKFKKEIDYFGYEFQDKSK
ncbi:MAG: sulfotransferase family 2 domain-containing protein [Candidatus Muiribacteriota bacterium]